MSRSGIREAAVFVVLPHLGLEDGSPALHDRFERIFASWTRPSLALLAGTSLGAAPWREGTLADETTSGSSIGGTGSSRGTR